jgi:hypothetical protein
MALDVRYSLKEMKRWTAQLRRPNWIRQCSNAPERNITQHAATSVASDKQQEGKEQNDQRHC